ncbi:hypothetical protein [Polaribacter gochangensis]|mgnify:CR=1 FL=1|uniref:hypothetical protein n=1 Tax=Polaribacter gochangensis TaxID=3252903 RepID=UPI003904BE7C
MKIVNVSGGYWTGSSAVIALLEEFDNVSVCPTEYSAFGYGELFAHLMNEDEKKIANSKLIFEQFNKTERLKYFWSILRVFCRALKIFPKKIFYPRVDGENLFGSNYKEFCSKTYKQLFRDGLTTQKRALSLFFKAIEKDSLTKKNNQDLLILDQMISPSYIKHFNFFDDKIKHIVIDRNWRDQYAEIRNKLPSIVGKNIAIGVNPLNEGLIKVDSTIEMFSQIRSRFNDDIKHIRKMDNVLVLNFEDIINDKINTKNKVFDFLNIAEGNWDEYSVFDENISKNNINKWKHLNIKEEINLIENTIE